MTEQQKRALFAILLIVGVIIVAFNPGLIVGFLDLVVQGVGGLLTAGLYLFIVGVFVWLLFVFFGPFILIGLSLLMIPIALIGDLLGLGGSAKGQENDATEEEPKPKRHVSRVQRKVYAKRIAKAAKPEE